MTTKTENILAAVKTALAGTTGVGTKIYRSRVVPLTRNETPALVIEPTSNTCEQNTGLNHLDWNLQLRVLIIVRGSTTVSPDQAADPTLESLHSKMLATSTLGGLAIDVQPLGHDYVLQDGDLPTAVISTNWVIKYRTLYTDLTQ